MIIERNVYSEIKKVIDTPEAIVITGMRRVGKTTLLRYIMEKNELKNSIFLDFENPVNQKYFEERNYDKIVDNLKFLGIDVEKKAQVFLDEVQYVKEIPSVVKYLMDNYKIKFFLSGSSSFYLKNLFSESLSGRKYIFELFPLSFDEYLKLKKVKINTDNLGKISEAAFEKMDKYYSEYLLFGGFPGVVKKESREEKEMMLEDIFSSYFQLDVRQMGDFRKLNVFRDLMLLLMERVGTKLDIQKISRELKISRETVYEYVSFLENTYFIKLIRPYTTNRDIEIRSMPKVYLCDTGMLNHFASVKEGVIFENSVFLILRLAGQVNYYQRKSGAEIDFILNKQIGYEVKINPAKQHLKKLNRMAEEIGLKEYSIVSRKYSKLDKITFGFVL